MFFLKTKPTGLFFCFVTTLLLLKPLSVNAQSIKPSNVSDRRNLESLNIKSDAEKLAQFEREEVEVDIVEPIETRETNRARSYISVGGNIGLGGDDTQIGDGAFAVLGKGALTRHFALHPAVLFGDKNTIFQFKAVLQKYFTPSSAAEYQLKKYLMISIWVVWQQQE
ncbi:hypothetical protein [Stanieria cyanosphaera]|nr:hypothetical protein [Stanieria cyanosphaera]